MKNYRVYNKHNDAWVDALLTNTDTEIRAFEIDFLYGVASIGPLMDNVDIEFTSGITDAKKQQIFEGDFIQYTSFDKKEYIQLCPSLYYTHFWEETALNETVRVVGNKHDNPETTQGLVA